MFNQRIFLSLEQNNLISIKIVGVLKGQAETHVAISKNLTSDISNQFKAPCVVTSTDAINYYDRVAYHFTSLTAQHFGAHADYIILLLKSIQSMSMFL